MKNMKNMKNATAEYAAVKIAKMLVDTVYYQQELDELLQAHPALGSISASEIESVMFPCGRWSHADMIAEISFLASKVRKEDFLLGTAIMVVLERGVWGEVYPDGVDWHFGMPATAECCCEMHAARKRLHAKTHYLHTADSDWDM